jgi:hypothetical protein
MNFLIILILHLIVNAKASTDWQRVPTKFECNHIYAELQINGKSQYFFTDSGGGLKPFTFKETVATWMIAQPKYFETQEGKDKFVIAKIDWPKKIGWKFYPSDSENIELRIADCSKFNKNEFCLMKEFMKDGFVGAGWYASKVWRLDYIKGEVAYSTKLTNIPKTNAIPLGFKVESGKRITHQPSMSIEIDGKVHRMLFDTGATVWHSETAKKELGLKGSPFCAASFIRRSVFDDLQKKHPEWKVIKAGDKFSGGSDLIEVPAIKVGQETVGPIWFAARKEAIYEWYSKEFMDQNIDGAIGGNVFKHFVITIDYPKAMLYFEKP